MELRSYNVERIYLECVKCRVKDELGTDKEALQKRKQDIYDMVSQIDWFVSPVIGGAPIYGKVLWGCNQRLDGEIWTIYLQIIEMLILLGKAIGCIEFEGKLGKNTTIIFKYANEEKR